MKWTKLAQSQLITAKSITMSNFLLVVFLLCFLQSSLAHAEHFTDHFNEQLPTVEFQDCHTCHQGMDAPPALLSLQWLSASGYYFIVSSNSSTQLIQPQFVQPLLRAPPVIAYS